MQKTAYLFIVLLSTITGLVVGKDLLIPFVFSLLVWVLIRGVKLALNKNIWIKNNIPSWLKNITITAIFFSIFALISKVLTYNIKHLASSYKTYASNIKIMSTKINELFNIDIGDLVASNSQDLDFSIILNSIFNSLSGIFGNALIIILYALFIILEETNFNKKLKLIFSDKAEYANISELLNKIENAVISYLGLKTIVSLLTGILSYFTLLVIGIDSPMFWAFLIFMLNYIPTIGSLIGTLFPAFFCLLQFGGFSQASAVLTIVGGIQLLVGNIIEPKLMGNSLNLSSLVTLLALSFWGALWGITGMVLSIPITVIIAIILTQFDKTKPIAILLSEKGKLI